jgi:hypothetical protein
MKFAIFPALDYQLILQFIQQLSFTDINSILFERLKMFLCFPQDNIPTNRWESILTIFSLDQYNNFISLLNLFLPENASSMEKLEKLIFQEFESEIQFTT